MGLTKIEQVLEDLDYKVVSGMHIPTIRRAIEQHETLVADTDICFLNDMLKYLKQHNYDYVEVMINDWID